MTMSEGRPPQAQLLGLQLLALSILSPRDPLPRLVEIPTRSYFFGLDRCPDCCGSPDGYSIAKDCCVEYPGSIGHSETQLLTTQRRQALAMPARVLSRDALSLRTDQGRTITPLPANNESRVD